ncbi:MAG: SDR family oxidoreductase [Vulcanimicrobiaceae bacterium]
MGGAAIAVAADVTSEADVKRLVNTTVERFGAVDVLVNNAGGVGAFAPFDDLSLDDWRSGFELNVFSVVTLIKAVLPRPIEPRSSPVRIFGSTEARSQPSQSRMSRFAGGSVCVA